MNAKIYVFAEKDGDAVKFICNLASSKLVSIRISLWLKLLNLQVSIN